MTVAPNTIYFNAAFDDLDEKLVENAAVVGTVVGVIILYISLLVLCRKLDKRDKVKVTRRAGCKIFKLTAFIKLSKV